MAIQIVITYIGDAAVQARELKGAVARGMAWAIQWWHRNVLRGHFQAGASGKYSYEPRTEKYRLRKFKKLGHNTPLVYTGALREQTIRSLSLAPLKTKAEATGRMKAPRYAYMTPTAKYKHSLGAEVSATVQAELDTMAELTHRRATRELNELKQQRVVTVT